MDEERTKEQIELEEILLATRELNKMLLAMQDAIKMNSNAITTIVEQHLKLTKQTEDLCKIVCANHAKLEGVQGETKAGENTESLKQKNILVV